MTLDNPDTPATFQGTWCCPSVSATDNLHVQWPPSSTLDTRNEDDHEDDHDNDHDNDNDNDHDRKNLHKSRFSFDSFLVASCQSDTSLKDTSQDGIRLISDL